MEDCEISGQTNIHNLKNEDKSRRTKIVPIVPRGFGNTKQIPPSKHWTFTLNNYTLDEYNLIISSNSSIVPRYVIQEEIGENGTPHLQGYIMFKKKTRPKSIFDNNRIHWEKVRNIKACIAYCQKEDTRKEGTETKYRGIERPYKLEIRNWRKWMSEAEEIIKKEPEERKIHWFWEPKGCAGKTVYGKYVFTHYEDVMVLSGKAHDMKNSIVQYIEKNNRHPKTIIINVPRSNVDYLSYTGIESIKDMFFYCGKYEGGMVCGPEPRVIIFANEEPDYEKMSMDRWDVRFIDEGFAPR